MQLAGPHVSITAFFNKNLAHFYEIVNPLQKMPAIHNGRKRRKEKYYKYRLKL